MHLLQPAFKVLLTVFWEHISEARFTVVAWIQRIPDSKNKCGLEEVNAVDFNLTQKLIDLTVSFLVDLYLQHKTVCPELHTGRHFWGTELRRALLRDDDGIQGQQISRCNSAAASLGGPTKLGQTGRQFQY
jgi:hypothetical protein